MIPEKVVPLLAVQTAIEREGLYCAYCQHQLKHGVVSSGSHVFCSQKHSEKYQMREMLRVHNQSDNITGTYFDDIQD